MHNFRTDKTESCKVSQGCEIENDSEKSRRRDSRPGETSVGTLELLTMNRRGEKQERKRGATFWLRFIEAIKATERASVRVDTWHLAWASLTTVHLLAVATLQKPSVLRRGWQIQTFPILNQQAVLGLLFCTCSWEWESVIGIVFSGSSSTSY